MKEATKDIKQLIELRGAVIKEYAKLRSWQANPNALMKEADHARALHRVVVRMDFILKDYVNFE